MTLLETDEQQALAAAVKQFVADVVPLSAVRATVDAGVPYDAEVWRRIAQELELAGLAVPTEYGGSGGTWSDLLVVLRELGAGLVPSPLFASGVLAAGVLLSVGDEQTKKTWLPRISSGEIIATLASSEQESPSWLPPSAGLRAENNRLSGTKIAVPNGAQANVLIVTATDGLYLVESSAPGLTITEDPSFDLTRSLAVVQFDAAPALPVASDAAAPLERFTDLVNVSVAAEQTGALRTCLESITEYAKIRYSFGLPIGAYQGVKHKLADMYCELSLADALVRRASEELRNNSPEAPLAATEARLAASAAYVQGAKTSMTLHGGIGYTWEHHAHLFYRNAVAGNVLFGDPAHRQDRLADQLGI